MNKTNEKNMTKEMEELKLNEAARILQDEIWPITDKLDKALLIIEELTNEYFRRFNRGDKEDHIGIVWEFSRNATYAEIVNDYVFQAKEAMETLNKRSLYKIEAKEIEIV